jgi:hypothetical protein
VNRYFAINIEGKIGQPTVIRTSSFIIIRIECILLKFHWGMKALIELHFQHEALKMYFGQRFHTPMKLQKNAFNS